MFGISLSVTLTTGCGILGISTCGIVISGILLAATFTTGCGISGMAIAGLAATLTAGCGISGKTVCVCGIEMFGISPAVTLAAC